MRRERENLRRLLRLCILISGLSLALPEPAQPTSVRPEEMAEARSWVAAKFQGVQKRLAPKAGLLVLANNDPLQKNARGERPMRIADAQYTRGLYCHAVSKVVVLQFWKGDRIRSQNVWRRWMLAHNLPRPGGELPPVQLAACSSHQFGEMIHADTQSQKLFIDRDLAEGGLRVEIEGRPGSVVVTYRRVK